MRVSWVLWYTTALHLFWGLVLLYSPLPLGTTPIYALRLLFVDRHTLSAILIGSSILAIISMLKVKSNLISTYLLGPQFMLLMTSMVGILVATINSSYADGVTRAGIFILSDQFPMVLTAILYPIAALEHLGVRNNG